MLKWNKSGYNEKDQPEDGMVRYEYKSPAVLIAVQKVQTNDDSTENELIDQSIEEFRDFQSKDMVEVKGALVEAEEFETNGVKGKYAIGKKKGDGPTGINYMALVIAKDSKNRFYKISIHAIEQGMTGTRESAIMVILNQKGEIDVELKKGWAVSPYDENYDPPKGTIPRNRADDKEWDEKFPNHPLTLVREAIINFTSTVEFEAEAN